MDVCKDTLVLPAKFHLNAYPVLREGRNGKKVHLEIGPGIYIQSSIWYNYKGTNYELFLGNIGNTARGIKDALKKR